MSIAPDGYNARIADQQVERYLKLFGAVEITGTKWCGKTWTSLAHAQSITYVDRGSNLDVIRADPTFALQGETPHVIDEWQQAPAVWDVVRHAVDDAGGKRGQWILTGSSTPHTSETSHSGAGRIGHIRMRPMSLQESGESTGQVSLRGLFEGTFAPTSCQGGIAELARLICRGGWPGTVGFEADDAQVVTAEYLTALCRQTIPRMGGEEALAERLVRALARNLGQAAKLTTLAADVFASNGDDTATDWERRKVADHIELLEHTYALEEIPGWAPAARSPRRVRTKPKRYFADPSIPATALGMSASSLLQDWQTLGLLVESLCMRDLAVYAQALPRPSATPLRYYRDDAGLEVDAIVEQADGSWGAIEIKTSIVKVDDGATSLLRLKNKLADDAAGRTAPPSFLAVVVGEGEAAYRRPDGVLVIPIRALGA